jgi:hypothetical protein
MNDQEIIACQYVLKCIEILKYRPVVQMSHDFLISTPITLEEYPIICLLLVPKPIKSLSVMLIHMVGEELKKQIPDTARSSKNM